MVAELRCCVMLLTRSLALASRRAAGRSHSCEHPRAHKAASRHHDQHDMRDTNNMQTRLLYALTPCASSSHVHSYVGVSFTLRVDAFTHAPSRCERRDAQHVETAHSPLCIPLFPPALSSHSLVPLFSPF